MSWQTTCEWQECDARVHARGLCRRHYDADRRGSTAPVRRYGRRACTVAGCDRRHHGRGFCLAHLKRVRKHGDPMADVPFKDGGTSTGKPPGPAAVRGKPLGPRLCRCGELTDYHGRLELCRECMYEVTNAARDEATRERSRTSTRTNLIRYRGAA